MELQINQFWILKAHSMINSANEHEPDVSNTFYGTRVWNLKISIFATQRFCRIWKTISPWILHRKSQIFQHAFNFTSSLTYWSQFISNMILLQVKSYANEHKCKQWRQQRSPLYWSVQLSITSSYSPAQSSYMRFISPSVVSFEILSNLFP